MVEYQKEVEIAKWLMSRGYSEFDFRDGLWMEDTVLDHSWRDIIELMHDYAAAQSTEVRPDTAQQTKCAKHKWKFSHGGGGMNVYRCEVCGAETDDWMNWGDL